MSDATLLQQAYNDTIRAFVRAMELHAPGEGTHAERVAVLAVATAHEMGWRGEELVTIRRAAALHDVGKIAIPCELLTKQGGLTQLDLDELRLHAVLASKVLESLSWLEDAVPMIRSHHERWDGTGYPEGLAGEAIPLGARIIGVSEAFDVMTWRSAFREPIEPDEALEELERCTGTQFDPAVVRAFKRAQAVIQPLDLD